MPTPHRIALAPDGKSGAIQVTFGDPGTFEYGGVLFCLAFTVQAPSGVIASEQYDVYQSIDGGVTWTVCDVSNNPIKDTSSALLNGVRPVNWRPGDRFVSFIWVDSLAGTFAPISFVQFDLSTKTWGTKIAGGPSLSDTFSAELWQRGDGSFVIYYDVGTGVNGDSAPGHCYVVTLTGPTWGSPQLADDLDQATAIGSVLDASDRLHFLYVHAGDASSILHYRQWLAGSFSASSDVGLFTPYRTNITQRGLYVPATDEIFFCFSSVNGTPVGLYAIEGTPSSAPVFNLQTVSTDIHDAHSFPVLRLHASTIYFAFVDKGEGTTATEALLYYTQTVGSGLWSGGFTVFWQWSLDPPLPDPGTTQLEQFFLFDIQQNGDITAAIVVVSVAAISAFCGVMYALFVPASPPAITLACPVDPPVATIGVPYNSGPPVVTGGTPPYTFSIVGGSLPPGFTLDPDTGVVSGITFSTGMFNYTLEVTDSSSPQLQAVVDAPCPITVTGGSGTQPCLGVVMHPETDVQFKLIKVIATLKEETHLPVRGSVK